MGVVIIIVILVVVVLGAGLLAFNGLARRRNRTQEAWSEIDVELKRRHDLIPNLLETVKGYAAHEQGTFEAVTAARAGAINAGVTGDPAKIAPAENILSQSLLSLFAVAENYPQLRAVEGFSALKKLQSNDQPFAKFNHATAAMCIDGALQHHENWFHHIFDTHPPIAERITKFEQISVGTAA